MCHHHLAPLHHWGQNFRHPASGGGGGGRKGSGKKRGGVSVNNINLSEPLGGKRTVQARLRVSLWYESGEHKSNLWTFFTHHNMSIIYLERIYMYSVSLQGYTFKMLVLAILIKDYGHVYGIWMFKSCELCTFLINTKLQPLLSLQCHTSFWLHGVSIHDEPTLIIDIHTKCTHTITFYVPRNLHQVLVSELQGGSEFRELVT